MAEIKEITPLFLTAAGLKLQAKVQAGITQLSITRVLIGSGYLDSETDKELLTAPITEIPSHTSRDEGTNAAVDITRLYYDEGGGTAMISIHVESGDNDPTYLREFCIMASDPNDGEIMYGYTNLGDEALPLPKYDGRARAVYDISLPTVIANTENVSINVTKIVEVPAEEFDAHKTAPVLDHPDGSVTSAKLAESIALRGTPTAPTADTDADDTQIATTAFVQKLINMLKDNTGPVYLNEIKNITIDIYKIRNNGHSEWIYYEIQGVNCELLSGQELPIMQDDTQRVTLMESNEDVPDDYIIGIKKDGFLIKPVSQVCINNLLYIGDASSVCEKSIRIGDIQDWDPVVEKLNAYSMYYKSTKTISLSR